MRRAKGEDEVADGNEELVLVGLKPEQQKPRRQKEEV